MRAEIAAALTVPLVAVGCGTSSSTPFDVAAVASGADVQELAAGKLDGLPTGPLYARVIHFAQPASYIIHSTQHVAGFVYVEVGIHRLTLAGQAPIDLVAGEATFHQSVTHTHLNPGPGPSVWYFIAVWSSSARSLPPVDPIASPEFQSADLAPGSLPPGGYSEVLRKVTLQGSGRTEAHRFGGLAVIFVLQGALEIRSGSGPPVTLADERGAVYVPQVALQEINKGSKPVVFLEYLTTPAGRQFEVPLPTVPG